MKYLLLLAMIVIPMGMMSCSDIADGDIAEVIIDGKTYEISINEVAAADNKTASDDKTTPPVVKSTVQPGAIYPPDFKYEVIDGDNLYLTDLVIHRNEVITITAYSAREDGYWIYHEGSLDLPKDVIIEQLKVH